MEKEVLHKPTLESIEMVEETAKTLSGKLTRYQLWKKLPRKMMYQTYTLILKYLEKSGKISINQEKKLVWTAKPALENIFKPSPSKKTMEKSVSELTPEQEKILESLNPDERAILGLLDESVQDIEKKSGLDQTRVLRALQFLGNKGIVKVKSQLKKIVDLGDNGVVYLKNGLPERRLIDLLVEKQSLELKDAGKEAKLSENELKAALGALKGKAMISLKQGKIILEAKKEEIIQKSLEEQFIESLPLILEQLKPEQKLAYENLKDRKDILKIEDEKNTEIELTELGKKISSINLDSYSNMIEALTSDIIKEESWKGKKFRRYDIKTKVPEIYGGKRQPYYYFLKDVRKKLTEIGFKEMTGNTLVSEFWNFDALFQPQFHAARDWSDTYRIKSLKTELPDKKIVEAVKKVHEEKWKYKWNEEKAKQLILIPQGTAISSQTLAKEREGKFFAISRTYRPDVVDAKHLSEFNQVEGIVIGKNLDFRNLLHILKTFAIKVAGAKEEEIRFAPSYYPFTEPSVQMDIKHPKLGWIEIGGAGIFRKEVTESLTGTKDKDLRVLAWGLGIDRLAMLKLGINDIRELFSNNIEFLREEKL